MTAKTLAELPQSVTCRLCEATKPLKEIVVFRLRTTGEYKVRPRCKACHNARERGHRRAWKTKYLRWWRERNPELNESYWRAWQRDHRKLTALRAYARFTRDHHAVLIQGRLRRRLRMRVSIGEARKLLHKYGPCFPGKAGLTPKGLKECERIRSRMRLMGKRVRCIEIRLMVYEDGFYKKPSRQPIPFEAAARRLRHWQAQRRMERAS